MRELNVNEIEQINGGCAEHCWGDVDVGEVAGNMVGGAIAGARGGPGVAIIGAIAAGIGTILGQLWN